METPWDDASERLEEELVVSAFVWSVNVNCLVGRIFVMMKRRRRALATSNERVEVGSGLGSVVGSEEEPEFSASGRNSQ
jgi:hypothetical protein